MRRGSLSRSGCQRLKALVGAPSLSLSPSSLLPLPSTVLRLPLSPLCVSGEEEGRAWCRGVVDLAWSKEEMANRPEGPHWGSFFVKGRDCLNPSRSGWIGSPSGFIDSVYCFPHAPLLLVVVLYLVGGPGLRIPSVCLSVDVAMADIRRGIGSVGCDLIAARLAIAIRALSQRVSWSRQGLLSRHFARLRQGCRGALPHRDGVATALGVAIVSVLPRYSALEGLSRSELVFVAWDPCPCEPLRERSGLRACSSWQPIGQTLELRGKRGLDNGTESFVELSCLGLGRRGRLEFFLAQTRQSLVSLPRSTLVPEPRREVRQAGARLASRACGLRVPLLAASGGGLVVVVVTTLPHDVSKPVLLVVSASVFTRFRSGVVLLMGPRPCGGLRQPFLWWDVILTCLLHGLDGCAERCFRCVPDSVGFCGSRGSFLFSEFLLLWPVRDCCCCVACVVSVVARCVRAMVAQLAVDSLVVVFPVWRTLAGKSRRGAPGHLRRISVRVYSVCRVASLIECCDTCLWLLSAWCWLVVSSGEVLPKSFSVGSGGSEDCFVLVYVVVVLPQGLRCTVALAGAFWWIFPRTVHWQFWWRFSQGQLVLLLLAAVFSLEVCRLVGLRSDEVLPGQLLALLVEVTGIKSSSSASRREKEGESTAHSLAFLRVENPHRDLCKSPYPVDSITVDRAGCTAPLRSDRYLSMAENDDMGYENMYDEMYDPSQQLPQFQNRAHADPSSLRVNAMDIQAPHVSPRRDAGNTSSPVNLSQILDILQSLQASELQEVQAALKGKIVADLVHALHPNASVQIQSACDPTARASPAPSRAHSTIQSRPHNFVGRHPYIQPSFDAVRPVYQPQIPAQGPAPAGVPSMHYPVQADVLYHHLPSGAPPKPSTNQLAQVLLEKVSKLEQEIKMVSAPKDSFELALPSMPVFHLPPSEMPVYRRYNGTGNPFVHIKEFMYESSFWKDDNHALAFLFRRSLEGPALEWFYSLEPVDVENFETVQRKFLQRYKDRVGPVLSITDLTAEKMRADEDFTHYADRWRTLVERLSDPLSEAEQVKMITVNVAPQFRHILAMNKLTTMEELYERARYIQTQLKDSPIMAMFEPKARTLKKSVGTPAGGPTTEGDIHNEQVSAMGNPSPSTYRPNTNTRAPQPQ
ncbi:hypothetical protein Taro_013266 [Colocasia esculenta]|uniref:Ty3 transposon capsid-like protein domain-containing protein n=1 Tax=Colocasia esculenta TaxID=4460 RepID=A0A843UFQ5_COLES|nr:hypothetical protein [Colocasia esculenta]